MTLTREMILTMEAGPEIDFALHDIMREVIEDGFGSSWPRFTIEHGYVREWQIVRPGKVQSESWNPSHEHNCTFGVVEWLNRHGWFARLWQSKGKHWHCDLHKPGNGPINGSPSVGAWAESLPLAICRAALLTTLEAQP